MVSPQVYRIWVPVSEREAAVVQAALDEALVSFEVVFSGPVMPPLLDAPVSGFSIFAGDDTECRRIVDVLTAVGSTGHTVEPYSYDRFEWVEKWKEFHDWSYVSSRVAVGPPFRANPFVSAGIAIVIDPGQGFGTGNHETTRIALSLLDTYVSPGARVVDAGCGSGVLAIGALRLGAGHVVGFDIDGEAISESRSNAGLNGVSFDAREGDGADVTGEFDVVVANMLAHELMPMAGRLKGWVAPGGVLLLTGLVTENFDTFESRFFFGCDPLPGATGWKSPCSGEETGFVCLEKRIQSDWWGGAWRRRS